MLVKWPLIRWQMRQMRFWNVVVAATTTVYTLTRTEPFQATSPAWFPPLHAAAIAWFLGRSTTPAAGYLHLQGFSRTALWWHTVVSAAGCALWAWAPAALVILTPLRSAWQDLLQNPSYPYIAPLEHRFVGIALWEYAVFVPLGLYVAARWGHPARGNDCGLISALPLVGLFWSGLHTMSLLYAGRSFAGKWPLLLAGVLVAGLALIIGQRLHREREVQP